MKSQFSTLSATPRRATWGIMMGIASFVLCGATWGRASAATQPAVLVVSKQPGAKYATIQAAIDAAPDSATIRIEAGDYLESLSIKKPLTLEGAGWQKTTITIPNDKSADIAQAVNNAQKQIEAGKSRRDVQQALAQLERKFAIPCIAINGAQGIVLRDLKVTSNPTGFAGSKERFSDATLIRVDDAKARIDNCAVVGSPGDGIDLTGGADATIDHCLIAAAWGTGISIGSRQGTPAKAHIVDCDVRNCYYAGIRSGLSDTTVEHCRISGAAWHGIRYADSPVIKDNIIWGNTRCGIYADPNKDGATIEGNLFYRNRWDGIACWNMNIGRITGNTFAYNGREALSALGGAKPVVEKNVFLDNSAAIHLGAIGGRSPTPAVGDPKLRHNVFWQNQVTIVEPATEGGAPTTRAVKPAADTDSLYKDPKYKDPEKGDFSTPANSPARNASAGVDAGKLPPFASPWPITEEEKAIIPDGPERDYNLWKNPT